MMGAHFKKWWPVALCCIPALVIAAALGIGLVSLANLSRWAAVLACPLAMGLMLWMMSKNMGSEQATGSHHSAAERLHALQAQRRQLDLEIAEVENSAAGKTA
jgi:Mn2+/Fe2+ NRAMP family transporter